MSSRETKGVKAFIIKPTTNVNLDYQALDSYQHNHNLFFIICYLFTILLHYFKSTFFCFIRFCSFWTHVVARPNISILVRHDRGCVAGPPASPMPHYRHKLAAALITQPQVYLS